MAEDQKSEIPQFEMEITLPRILKTPLQMEDGTIYWEGDRVKHAEFGIGTIVRVWTYESIGTCLYIDFGNNLKKEIHPSFVKKVSP